MINVLKNNKARRLVKNVFQDINDMVVPTMGAKGLLVSVNDDFGKSVLTDDGVTVAREARKMDGIESRIAVDMIEAASTTEKEALDGTTLTILLTNELYKLGYRKIMEGKHPQVVADRIEKEIGEIRKMLVDSKIEMKDKYVRDIATISTKIPRVGEIVYDAYKYAGPEMNIVIEMDREDMGVRVEKSKGFSIESGYMSEAMAGLCEDGETWKCDGAWVVLLKEGVMTQAGLGGFFKSIPSDHVKDGFIFVLNPSFNPNTLRLLIDTLMKNNFKYQFIFVNEAKSDDVYMDLAAVSGGKVQDASNGIGDYLFDYCGWCDHAEIGIDKSMFICDMTGVEDRIKQYKKRLNKKYKLSGVDEALYTRRLGALENGIVKIIVGVPTVTEFQTLKLKLDDAIGAVKVAFGNGIVLGGGKALWNLDCRGMWCRRIMHRPLIQICKNAGVKIYPGARTLRDKNIGVDVKSKEIINLKDAGILDSYKSIDEALKNASSIACSYIRCNCLINQK